MIIYDDRDHVTTFTEALAMAQSEVKQGFAQSYFVEDRAIYLQTDQGSNKFYPNDHFNCEG